MQTDQTPTDHLLDLEVNAPIYSRNAIRIFAIFFSAIFGGVLLMQNLKDMEKPREARIALFSSIGITILVVILSSLLRQTSSSLGIILNVLGASVLSDYIFKKYIPNEDEHPKKTVWKPLIIGLLIFVPLLAFSIYGAMHNQ
jgi:hypothetical protein